MSEETQNLPQPPMPPSPSNVETSRVNNIIQALRNQRALAHDQVVELQVINAELLAQISRMRAEIDALIAGTPTE